MRKQFKKKLRSCSLCKPHKRGLMNRWKNKEQNLAKEHTKEIHKFI